MKKFALMAWVLLLVFGMTMVTYAHPPVTLVLDGKVIETDVPPQIVNGRTMVPLRVISESFGCEVGWNQELKTATIWEKKGDEIFDFMMVTVDYPVASYQDARDRKIEAPPILYQNRTLVPMRVIANFLNADIDWDQSTYTVTMKKGPMLLFDEKRAAQFDLPKPPGGDKRDQVLAEIKALQKTWEARTPREGASDAALVQEAEMQVKELREVVRRLVYDTPRLIEYVGSYEDYMANIEERHEAWMEEYGPADEGGASRYYRLIGGHDFYYRVISDIIVEQYGLPPITGEDLYGN